MKASFFGVLTFLVLTGAQAQFVDSPAKVKSADGKQLVQIVGCKGGGDILEIFAEAEAWKKRDIIPGDIVGYKSTRKNGRNSTAKVNLSVWTDYVHGSLLFVNSTPSPNFWITSRQEKVYFNSKEMTCDLLDF